MDFTQSMDNGYMIPSSVAVGSGEATDIRCVCDTVEDFKAFLNTTGMELRYEGLVSYEKVNKVLKVYKGNDTWQTVGGGNVVFRDIEHGEVFEVYETPVIYGDIVVSASSLSINEGESLDFTIKLNQEPTTDQYVSIAISNDYCIADKSTLIFTPANYNVPQVIKVTGVHIANSYTDKSSDVTISSFNVPSKNISVTIKNIDEQVSEVVPVDSVVLDKTSHSLEIGKSVYLNATVLPSNATNKDVVWTSSNSNVTIDGGLVTAVTEGSCLVTVTTVDGGKTATCSLNIVSSNPVQPSDANVVYEEDGYICVPVELLEFKNINVYNTENYKLYSIGGDLLNKTNGSLLSKDTTDLNVLLKDINNFNVISWGSAINANDLNEGFAAREGYYIVLKILNSNIGDKDVHEYFKEKYGEVFKFKLREDVTRVNISTDLFGTFSTRAAYMENGQYVKVEYSSDVTDTEYSLCSYGFKTNQTYPWTAPAECIKLKTTSLEILFKDKLKEITLDGLKEYIELNPLTIWI